MDQITVTVLIKDNKYKGLIGPNTTFPNSHWWDSELQVSVPKSDWEAEKVTITTIRNFMNFKIGQ